MRCVVPLVIAASGCAAGPAADAARYSRVVAGAVPDPEQAFSVCATIADPELRGDCALVAARRAGPRPGQYSDVWCDRVPEGTWRYECLFETSEAQLRAGRLERATDLCMRAGPFLDDCAQHLWQDEVRDVSARGAQEGFLSVMPQADALFARWGARLDGRSDFESRFWVRFFEWGFTEGGGPDAALCAGLPPLRLSPCLQAARTLSGLQLPGPARARGG